MPHLDDDIPEDPINPLDEFRRQAEGYYQTSEYRQKVAEMRKVVEDICLMMLVKSI